MPGLRHFQAHQVTFLIRNSKLKVSKVPAQKCGGLFLVCDQNGLDSSHDGLQPCHHPAFSEFSDAKESQPRPHFHTAGEPPPKCNITTPSQQNAHIQRRRKGKGEKEGRERSRRKATGSSILTFLAAICSPAAVVVLVVDGGLLAQWLLLHCPWTQVPAFFWGFVSHDVVIGHCIQDQGPVHRGEVTKVSIFLNPDGPPSDVPQVVKPNIFEIGHLEDDQGVVVEEFPAADDREVREEVTKALEAGHAEQQQVFSDDRELGEAVAAVVLCFGDEQDVEVALDHRAVLQALQLLVVVADVDARPADWRETRGQGGTFSVKRKSF